MAQAGSLCPISFPTRLTVLGKKPLSTRRYPACDCWSHTSHEIPMKSPWNPHEIPMKSPWNPHEIPMKSLWNPYEILMKSPWNPHEIPLNKLPQRLFHRQLLPSDNSTVCFWTWPLSSLMYPSKTVIFFQSKLLVYQRVKHLWNPYEIPMKSPLNPIKSR